MNRSSLPFTSHIAALLLLCCVFTLPIGCETHTPKVAFRFDSAGNPVDYKRHEKFPQRDFFHHFSREVYVKPDSPQALAAAGESQTVIIENWGVPDWVRKPFKGIQNERVQEWIYLDESRIFQFVGADLVFEGPVTDHEIVLLQRGYPDRAEFIRTIGDRVEKLYVYDNVPPIKLEEFIFREDHLHFSKESY